MSHTVSSVKPELHSKTLSQKEKEQVIMEVKSTEG
jgi:hypothetical protein